MTAPKAPGAGDGLHSSKIDRPDKVVGAREENRRARDHGAQADALAAQPRAAGPADRPRHRGGVLRRAGLAGRPGGYGPGDRRRPRGHGRRHRRLRRRRFPDRARRPVARAFTLLTAIAATTRRVRPRQHPRRPPAEAPALTKAGATLDVVVGGPRVDRGGRGLAAGGVRRSEVCRSPWRGAELDRTLDTGAPAGRGEAVLPGTSAIGRRTRRAPRWCGPAPWPGGVPCGQRAPAPPAPSTVASFGLTGGSRGASSAPTPCPGSAVRATLEGGRGRTRWRSAWELPPGGDGRGGRRSTTTAPSRQGQPWSTPAMASPEPGPPAPVLAAACRRARQQAATGSFGAAGPAPSPHAREARRLVDQPANAAICRRFPPRSRAPTRSWPTGMLTGTAAVFPTSRPAAGAASESSPTSPRRAGVRAGKAAAPALGGVDIPVNAHRRALTPWPIPSRSRPGRLGRAVSGQPPGDDAGQPRGGAVDEGRG